MLLYTVIVKATHQNGADSQLGGLEGDILGHGTGLDVDVSPPTPAVGRLVAELVLDALHISRYDDHCSAVPHPRLFVERGVVQLPSQVAVADGIQVVTVNAGMAKFSGVVQCDTLMSNSVISASYSPGAGNVW